MASTKRQVAISGKGFISGDAIKLGSPLSVVALVDSLVEHAYQASASDIHLVPEENEVRVRFRIDGVLRDVHTLPKNIYPEIISRIKIVTGLPTDEHQTALDGRFRTIISGKPVDIRVSIMPTYYGENASLRLLADQGSEHTLETLGFSESNREKILKAIQKPYGMILVTGPTGSGKTTTLYTIIKMLNAPERSIITIEDPIEYAIRGVEQVQVSPRTGLTFANGLRSILRQDPNIIMVGEIRDQETANIAVNAALTGHLLLSTIHTNDAATTLPRLIDMKVEPFLIASTVNIAIGQRLVRTICQNCKTEKRLSKAEAKSVADIFAEAEISGNEIFYEGKGCDMCAGSGYKGRISIQEVLVIHNGIRDAILRKAPASEIKTLAVQSGMETIIEDGLEKAKSGITTIREILKVVHE